MQLFWRSPWASRLRGGDGTTTTTTISSFNIIIPRLFIRRIPVCANTLHTFCDISLSLSVSFTFAKR